MFFFSQWRIEIAILRASSTTHCTHAEDPLHPSGRRDTLLVSHLLFDFFIPFFAWCFFRAVEKSVTTAQQKQKVFDVRLFGFPLNTKHSQARERRERKKKGGSWLKHQIEQAGLEHIRDWASSFFLFFLSLSLSCPSYFLSFPAYLCLGFGWSPPQLTPQSTNKKNVINRRKHIMLINFSLLPPSCARRSILDDGRRSFQIFLETLMVMWTA